MMEFWDDEALRLVLRALPRSVTMSSSDQRYGNEEVFK